MIHVKQKKIKALKCVHSVYTNKIPNMYIFLNDYNIIYVTGNIKLLQYNTMHQVSCGHY